MVRLLHTTSEATSLWLAKANIAAMLQAQQIACVNIQQVVIIASCMCIYSKLLVYAGSKNVSASM